MSAEQHPDLERQLARANARLERERQARRESEDIAEATLRRLFRRQQELDLLSGVASIANSAADAESALRDAMELIREATAWQVGHYFVPAADDPTVMVSSGQWSGDAEDRFARDLRLATSGMRFPPGVGIPGTAYSTGATWEQDIAASRNFPRQKWIEGGSAFAFPILVGQEVVAVMEFLQPTPRPLQQGLLDLATIIGIQLGRVVERMRSQRRELEYRTALQEAVEQRTADLIDARNRAEAQAQARATLFSTISHDLQTPLHAAIGELEQASTGLEPLRNVGRATTHLSELSQRIRAMLEVSGSPVDASPEHPRVVDLSRVLTDTVQAHSATAGRGSTPEVILAGAAAHPVLVDVEHFRRVLLTLLAGQLIDNSAGRIRIRLGLHSAWARLEVEQPAAGPDSGTVALAAQLAQEAGGELEVTPLPGDRQRVEVRLPVAVQGRQRRGAGTRVLLVDDIPVTRQISAAMLVRLGVEVISAANGREAIDALRADSVALVLMDLRMPVMGGLEAARRIRAGEAGADRSDVPIVALTAHAGAGDSGQSLLAGMDAHMGKPFTLDQLRAMVTRYVPELAGTPLPAGSPG